MNDCRTKHRDLSDLSARMGNSSGRRYWRSLEELADHPEFQATVQREFGLGASEWNDKDGGVSRRNFLQVMGASLALAGFTGLTGCARSPEGKIAPYVQPPQGVTPGVPQYYATAAPLFGYGRGVLVESQTGRPVKIEGNPQHPSSLGATDAITQATLLDLYDPDRSQVVLRSGDVSDWTRLSIALDELANRIGGRAKLRVRILSETVTSPTLLDQINNQFKKVYPNTRWHHFNPVGRDNAKAGSRLAFGRSLNSVYHFDKARRIVSLDGNFLADDAGSVRFARDYIQGRRLSRKGPGGDESEFFKSGEAAIEHTANWQSRLYVIESTPTLTGAMADHRLPLKALEIEVVAKALAAKLGVVGESSVGPLPAGIDAAWISTIAADLQSAGGAGLVVVGEYQPPHVHALAHAMNAVLTASASPENKPVTYTEDLEGGDATNDLDSLSSLLMDLDAGNVDLLIILGGNPVYNAPADLQVADRLNSFSHRANALSLHHSLYNNETTFFCQWHTNASHYLEQWSDVRSFDGTASLVQPLIAPLYAGKSDHELLATLCGEPARSGYEIVRDYWRGAWKLDVAGFENRWAHCLERGMIDQSQPVAVNTAIVGKPAQWLDLNKGNVETGSLEIIFRPDPTIWDGQFANNGWLQELPKPLTKVVWDNPILINPKTAGQFGLKTNDVVTISAGGGKAMGAVWLMPGQPQGAITVTLGYGRTSAGRVGSKTESSGGFNAYQLRNSSTPWFARADINKANATYVLATTQTQHLMEGRDLVRHGNTLKAAAMPQFSDEPAHKEAASHEEDVKARTVALSMYPGYSYSSGYKWGMSIDTTSCIGCNACVTACQAENNIPVVGKSEVIRERIMHWIRIDTYFSGEKAFEDLTNPEVYFQPLTCMQCENAPCEVVCPVGATAHSDEGLNDMAYNRCVGTRYCANNCPYKVRRFNFFQYSDQTTPVLKLLHNPEVSVRSRGVMEKCTYCVQRIDRSRIEAKKLISAAANAQLAGRSEQHDRLMNEARKVIRNTQSACQQVCPTQAIVFGDLNDSGSEVAQLKTGPIFNELNYGLLTELNTSPRTTYLPRLKNPNPKLAGGTANG